MLEVPRGSLYLGARVDPESGDRQQRLFLESNRLTTHAVLVGMTGSGKTGLGMVLLEEALLSDVPTLIIDPKGDMGNLLLNFPDLDAASFRPWIEEDAARREGLSPDAFAEKTAQQWKDGLESWDVKPGRLRALAGSAELQLLTPGSTMGRPLNILGSAVSAPASDVEAMRDEIEGFVSSLLSLSGIEADPLSSPEHVFLSTLLEQARMRGHTLDIGSLILQLMDPPLRKVGVFDVDQFFPKKDREKLAKRLNTLFASPSFATWLMGEPLDIQSLLYTPQGKPKASILYLSHLSEPERQMVVTMVLGKLVSWMRRQPGTSGLRALVYIDEVFGLAPPTAMPPSKKPILTLLKQARAFGVGMVLATQNPVDLDYKAMSNAGTWMIGRLQTERDKDRIIEGLRSASGSTDPETLSRLVGGLEKRRYLLYQASSDPCVFTSRWAMSYLRGPLTREEVGRLCAPPTGASGTLIPPPAPPVTAAAPPPPTGVPPMPFAPQQAGFVAAGGNAPATQQAAPLITATAAAAGAAAPQGVAPANGYRYVDPAAAWLPSVGAVPTSRRLSAAVALRIEMLFDERRVDLRHTEEFEAVVHPLGAGLNEQTLHIVDHDPRDFRTTPVEGASYLPPPVPLEGPALLANLSRDLVEYLSRGQRRTAFKNAALGLVSRVGEDHAAFAARCQAQADARANDEAQKLHQKYASRIDKVKGQLATLQQKARDAQFLAETQGRDELISGVGDFVGLFSSGRKTSAGLSRMASRRNKANAASAKAAQADERARAKHVEVAQLENELAGELSGIYQALQQQAAQIEAIDVHLEKDDIRLVEANVIWLPV
ncbi:MAG: DUF87 domain-containing protein [Polyangiaceae bacterium]